MSDRFYSLRSAISREETGRNCGKTFAGECQTIVVIGTGWKLKWLSDSTCVPDT